MSNENEDDAQPGPSKAPSPQPSASDSKISKRVQFGADVEDSGPQRSGSQTRLRKSSMVGTPGYVSQILEEYVEDEAMVPNRKEEGRKPIRKQTPEERRASVKAVDADISYYMKEVALSQSSVSSKKSSSQTKLATKKSGSQVKLPTLASKEELDELKILTGVPLADSRSSSEWRPSDLLEEPDSKQERSWVGTYIVGKDYWTAEEKVPEETRKVSFSADAERKPWYEMSTKKPIARDAAFLALKSKSLTRIETLKKEMDADFEEKRKQRAISAAVARQEPKVIDEWTDEFKEHFVDVAKGSDFSHRGTHMSMVDADKWLERAGILDHSELTLIHTGFSFLACGGSRHRGLSFEEFTNFLQMISKVTGLPVRDIVLKLSACMRRG